MNQILIFLFFIQNILNLDSNVRKVKEKVQLKCNRNVIESLILTGENYSPKDNAMATPLISKTCKRVFFNCCLEREFEELKMRIDNKFHEAG